MIENEIRLNENKMWREWITVRGLEPIPLKDIDDRINELQKLVNVDQRIIVKKAGIEQQENFMEILKDIYNSSDMVEMQTKLEIYFENIDSCLLNKYKYESNVSLLSK